MKKSELKVGVEYAISARRLPRGNSWRRANCRKGTLVDLNGKRPDQSRSPKIIRSKRGEDAGGNPITLYEVVDDPGRNLDGLVFKLDEPITATRRYYDWFGYRSLTPGENGLPEDLYDADGNVRKEEYEISEWVLESGAFVYATWADYVDEQTISNLSEQIRVMERQIEASAAMQQGPFRQEQVNAITATLSEKLGGSGKENYRSIVFEGQGAVVNLDRYGHDEDAKITEGMVTLSLNAASKLLGIPVVTPYQAVAKEAKEATEALQQLIAKRKELYGKQGD